MDPFEAQLRARTAEAFVCAEQAVERGQFEAYINEHLTESYLTKVCGKFGIPQTTRPELLAIAQYLHDSTGSKRPKPSQIKKEVAGLAKDLSALQERLEKLSIDAECAMSQLHESAFVISLSLPPIEETLAALRELDSWIKAANIPEGRAGRKLSPKFFAILMLRDLLKRHDPDGKVSAARLREFAYDVLDPVFGEDALDIKTIVNDVMKFDIKADLHPDRPKLKTKRRKRKNA